MVKELVLFSVVLGGCAPSLSIDRHSSNAPKIDPRVTYPHEVTYELLGQASSESCLSDGELEFYKGRTSNDADAIEPHVLYERAKYDAIAKVHGADGLVGVVARETAKNSTTCVEVAGRAYRITSLRAVGPAGGRDNNEVKTPTEMQ